MPTYDYKCKYCNFTTEQIHGVNEKPIKRNCPQCGKKFIKQMSAPPFILKGEGWSK